MIQIKNKNQALDYTRKASITFFILFLFTTIFIIVDRMANLRLATDLTMFYESAKAFINHQDIYSSTPWGQYQIPDKIYQGRYNEAIPFLGFQHSTNLNPPLFTLMMLPFSFFSYSQLLWIWNILSVLSGFFGLFLLNKVFYKAKFSSFFMMLALFYSSIPVISNIGLSQMGLFIFCILTGAWYLARSKNDVIGGVLFGFAFSLKLFIGLFLFLFLLQRRWKLLLVSLGVFLSLSFIAWILFGTKSYIEFFGVLHTINWYSNSWNASLFGFFIRICGGR